MEDTRLYTHILKRVNAVEKIVDIGCGDVRLVNFLAKKTGGRIVGVDISDTDFSKAERRAKKEQISSLVECVKGDAYRMKFKDGGFSLVTLLYTLHHIKEPSLALREIRRVMIPKGRLLVGANIVKRSRDKGECFRFTKRELLRLLKDAGFRRTGIKMFGGDFLIVEAQSKPRN